MHRIYGLERHVQDLQAEVRDLQTQVRDLQSEVQDLQALIKRRRKTKKQDGIMPDETVPTSFLGWTVQRKGGYYYLAKSFTIDGKTKVKWLYVGKVWEPSKARCLISQFETSHQDT